MSPASGLRDQEQILKHAKHRIWWSRKAKHPPAEKGNVNTRTPKILTQMSMLLKTQLHQMRSNFENLPKRCANWKLINLLSFPYQKNFIAVQKLTLISVTNPPNQMVIRPTLQGATKTVSTCPRQVVLASGQVDYQSYLSFGQVNLQEINKNKVSSVEKLV